MFIIIQEVIQVRGFNQQLQLQRHISAIGFPFYRSGHAFDKTDAGPLRRHVVLHPLVLGLEAEARVPTGGLFLSHFPTHSLRYGADRPERIGSEWPWNNGPIADVKVLVDVRSFRLGPLSYRARNAEYLAPVVDHTTLGALAHPASTQWMNGDQPLTEQPRGEWVS